MSALAEPQQNSHDFGSQVDLFERQTPPGIFDTQELIVISEGDKSFTIPASLYFDVPTKLYADRDSMVNSESELNGYSVEWAEFAADFMRRAGYQEDHEEERRVIVRSDGKQFVTSTKIMSVLALLHDNFYFCEDKALDINCRNSIGLPQSQDREFHHLLRSCVHSAKQGNTFNYQVLSTLTHSLFHEPKRKLPDGRIIYLDSEFNRDQDNYGYLQEIVGFEEAEKLKANSLWTGLLEAISSVAVDMEDRAITQTKIAERMMKLRNHFIEENIEFNQQEWSYLASLCRNNGIGDEYIKTIRGQILLATTELVMSQNTLDGPIVSIIADVTDNVMFPRVPLNGERVGEETESGFSESLENQANEAHFYIMMLELLDRQGELGELKDRVYEIIEPEKMSALREAMALHKEFLDAGDKAVKQHVMKLRQMLNEMGFKVINREELKSRKDELRRKHRDFDSYSRDMATLMNEDEVVVYDSRLKREGSGLLKFVQKQDDYDRFVQHAYKQFGFESAPPRFTVDWFKMVIPLITDLWALKIVRGTDNNAYQEYLNVIGDPIQKKARWDEMHNSLVESFAEPLIDAVFSIGDNIPLIDIRNVKDTKTEDEDGNEVVVNHPLWAYVEPFTHSNSARALSEAALGQEGYWPKYSVNSYNRPDDELWLRNVAILVDGQYPLEHMILDGVGDEHYHDGPATHTAYKAEKSGMRFNTEYAKRKLVNTKYRLN